MRTIPAVLVLCALLGAACSEATDSTLNDTVEAQGEAQEAIRQQLLELESSVQTVLASDASGDVQSLSTTLADLQESVAALDVLGADLEQRLADGESELATTGETVAGLDGELAELNEQVAGLVAAVNTLTTSVDDLGDDLGSLVTQFQRHRDDPNAHRGDRR